MRTKEMETLTRHFDTYLRQSDSKVLHPADMEPHIDALVYEPNDDYPFWKLVTVGASDFKMNAPQGAIGNRNEYIMFIDKDENLNDPEIVNWYFGRLMALALFPINENCFMTYGHSLDFGDGESEMAGAYLELPQVIEDPGILRCKLGLMKTAVCLQVVLLTRSEIDKLLEIGPEEFSYYLYPEEGDFHFISERSRSDKF